MNSSTSIELLTCSIAASVTGSAKNYCAEVIVARRGDLKAVVKRTFPNHRFVTKFSFGYARFGMPTVWVAKNAVLHGLFSNEELMYVRNIADQCFKAADEVTASRAAR